MKIETERLYLRPFAESDANHIWQLHSDPEVMKYTRMARALSKEESLKTLKKNVHDGIWAAFSRDDESFVGWFMLRKTDAEFPELGFMIVKRYWGKGFATEAARAVMEFKKEPKLSAYTAHENLASIGVLDKLGFQYICDLEDSKYFVKMESD